MAGRMEDPNAGHSDRGINSKRLLFIAVAENFKRINLQKRNRN